MNLMKHMSGMKTKTRCWAENSLPKYKLLSGG